MHTLSTETHTQATAQDIVQHMAWHLATHQMYGRVGVVADKPAEFLAALQHALRQVEREIRKTRTSTINAARRVELAAQLQQMHRCTLLQCHRQSNHTNACK